MWFPRMLSFGVGFLSLSQEILMVRLVGFAYQTTPKAFSFVLVFFLLGIALGAAAGKFVCRSRASLYRVAAATLAVAGFVDALIPFYVWRVVDDALVLACIIVIAAALKGALFPIAHHLGSVSQGPTVGSSVSKVYFANIMGSALGPLVTGFFLLEYFTLGQCMLLVATGTFALSAACALRSTDYRVIAVASLFCAVSLVCVWMNPFLVARMIKFNPQAGESIGQVIETRSGIVHTIRTPDGIDITFGGNVYDGRFNTDLRVNSNLINRAYLLAALHPMPKRILVIGMSSGAWTWVLARFPGVEHIDVVEINRGYLEVIENHPQISGILRDARITIHVDDGRRWLRRHPESKYDLIVMNTTFYWRAYSTNLLSIEFLETMKLHLEQRGVVTYNTTGLPDVYETTSKVFPFVRRYSNFVYASDHDFVETIPKYTERYWTMNDQGRPLFDPSNAEDRAAIDRMLEVPFFSVDAIRGAQDRPLEVITDDNMLTEYKYGRRMRLIPFLDWSHY